MVRIPVRFERVAAAFEEGGRVVRLCESSGSEHSPENSVDLSDLVKSFIERDYNDGVEIDNENEVNVVESDNYCSDSETRDSLRTLFGSELGKKKKKDCGFRHRIQAESDFACRLIPDKPSSQGFKRKLMSHLREKGFDAGLCKSKWEKFGRFPAGDYEYVDVNENGNRYIVEVLLAREFEIARPTSQYTSYLDIFPQIFVGKVEELKQVVRLMCTAIKASMKNKDMHVPPWRRNGYMQAKWFGSYKRTLNEVSTKKKVLESDKEGFSGKRSVGFEANLLSKISFNCRGDYSSNVGLRVGNLTAAFNV